MKRKITSLVLVFIVVLISLTGCFGKSAITVEKFNKIVKEQNCNVEENTDYEDTFIDVREGSRAKKSDKWEIQFFVLSGNKDAELMFEKDKNALRVYSQTYPKVQTEINNTNYTVYEVEGAQKFGYVIRIDNTVLYVESDKQYKDEIKAVIDKLGY